MATSTKKDEIKARIQDIFVAVFPDLKRKRFDFARKQNDFVGWDSFAHMQLTSRIEHAFGVEFSMKDVVSADSPARFVAMVKKEI